MSFDDYKKGLPKTCLITMLDRKPWRGVCPNCHGWVLLLPGELQVCSVCGQHFVVPPDTSGVGWPD